MYPVSLGLHEAKNRINSLITNGHDAESLVTSVFTVEKTIRRVLRQIIVSAGFRSIIADKILKKISGIEALQNAWEIYEPKGKKLTEILSQADWKTIKDAANKRNEIIHGQRVYDLLICKAETQSVLKALNNIITSFQNTYGYDGWTKAAMRKTSMLHKDPKVNL